LIFPINVVSIRIVSALTILNGLIREDKVINTIDKTSTDIRTLEKLCLSCYR